LVERGSLWDDPAAAVFAYVGVRSARLFTKLYGVTSQNKHDLIATRRNRPNHNSVSYTFIFSGIRVTQCNDWALGWDDPESVPVADMDLF
jgi:hypothetical protein